MRIGMVCLLGLGFVGCDGSGSGASRFADTSRLPIEADHVDVIAVVDTSALDGAISVSLIADVTNGKRAGKQPRMLGINCRARHSSVTFATWEETSEDRVEVRWRVDGGPITTDSWISTQGGAVLIDIDDRKTLRAFLAAKKLVIEPSATGDAAIFSLRGAEKYSPLFAPCLG
jgi:hypothetical protein